MKCRFFYMYLSSVRSLFRPVRIYLNLFTISLQKMLTSKSHLGIPGFVSSPRQSLNKSESSNYTANGDLAIKSVFVNIVSSAILNSQAGYRCTLVPRLPFPVPRSPLPVLVTSQKKGRIRKSKNKNEKRNRTIKKCFARSF